MSIAFVGGGQGLRCYGSEAFCPLASSRVPPLVVQESQKGVDQVELRPWSFKSFIDGCEILDQSHGEGSMEKHASQYR